MDSKQIAKKLLPPIVSEMIRTIKNVIAYRRFLLKGGLPFSTGYMIYRTKLVMDTLKNEKLLKCFRQDELLPQGYGIGIDERCVEYPWMISKLNQGAEIILDAGSVLNHEYILSLPILRTKMIHILTLAPEEKCFWKKNISYIFHDLRNIPIRDNYYDMIACLSTLEHIGCDNSSFTGKKSDNESRPTDYIIAIQEMCRVLKPGGTLLISVPFGHFNHLGTQQQFDINMLSNILEILAEFGDVIEAFYLYSAIGWNVAKRNDCVECQYVEWSVNLWKHDKSPNLIHEEPDRAVAARAVVCIQMIKKLEIDNKKQKIKAI
jgi:SAM-dependent methyltransferase